MNSKTVKNTLKWASGVLLLLVVVLTVHIYLVTRAKAPTARTVAMARIDLKQAIGQGDAEQIRIWLSQQKGVDHVLCNPESAKVVFTFRPVQTSANRLVSDFKTHFHYRAERYIPTPEEMQAGCPVKSTSLTYKVYQFFQRFF